MPMPTVLWSMLFQILTCFKAYSWYNCCWDVDKTVEDIMHHIESWAAIMDSPLPLSKKVFVPHNVALLWELWRWAMDWATSSTISAPPCGLHTCSYSSIRLKWINVVHEIFAKYFLRLSQNSYFCCQILYFENTYAGVILLVGQVKTSLQLLVNWVWMWSISPQVADGLSTAIVGSLCDGDSQEGAWLCRKWVFKYSEVMIILLLKVWSKEILAPCGHHLCSHQLPISVHWVLGLCTKYENLSLTNSFDISKLYSFGSLTFHRWWMGSTNLLLRFRCCLSIWWVR